MIDLYLVDIHSPIGTDTPDQELTDDTMGFVMETIQGHMENLVGIALYDAELDYYHYHGWTAVELHKNIECCNEDTKCQPLMEKT